MASSSAALKGPGREHKTVARILAGARECFERLGIEKATIVDIAEAASYSRPVIYKHFNDKADIVDSVCQEEMQALQLELNQRIARDLPFIDQLAEAIAEAVILAKDNIYIQRFMQDREAWVRSQSEAGKVHTWVRDRWASFLRRGQEQSILAPDLDIEQCVTWISMVQSLLLLRYASEAIDPVALRSFVRRFVVTPLIVPAG
jgi:AcrR family transcriptional regulator